MKQRLNLGRHQQERFYSVFGAGLILLAAVGLPGCGADENSQYSGSNEVTQLRLSSSELVAGQSVRVETFFTVETDDVGVPSYTKVIVRLPAGLAYVVNSARLFSGTALDQPRPREPDRLEECPGGTTLLYFDLNERELEDHGPENTGEEQKLGFEAAAVAEDENAVIEAAAGDDLELSCTRAFEVEADAAIQIRR